MIEGLIKTTINELNLSLTLRSGQAFRWRQHRDNDWIGIIDNKYVIQLTQNKLHVNYKVLNPFFVSNGQIDCKSEDNSEELKRKNHPTVVKSEQKSRKKPKIETNSSDNKFFDDLIRDYFRLEVNLIDLYNIWSKSDENFAKKSIQLKGIRILRQNPMETLFSFICSSNNNISRISKMIENLCQKYGHKLFESEDFGPIYSFPDVTTLAADSVEDELKNLGFGYRSKFIQKTAKTIVGCQPKCPQLWFESLKQMSYSDAREELMRMPGVGPKVADCIALMALNHLETIPVDTHVWQIAVNQYLPHLKKNKSLTDKSYKEIADFFRDRFGPMAGWAHSVLFAADLKLITK